MRGFTPLPSYPLDVVSGRTMSEIDLAAIETRGIPGLILMEQAGQGTAEGMLATLPPDSLHHTAILCGKGNNGGDGFVIARHLSRRGYKPTVALVGSTSELQGDARTNCMRMLEESIPLWECPNAERLLSFFNTARQTRVWVDALLGTGARGKPRGLIETAISFINRLSRGATVISVDIPSGVDADTGNVEGEAVFADWIYTMGLPKIGHILPPGLNYGKHLVVLDIGFPHDLLNRPDSPARLLTAREVDEWFPKRSLSTHKGQNGHLLTVAGSRGMTGAALMCAQSALYAGAGLVTAACPASLLPIYAGGVWEMMTLPVRETDAGSFSKDSFSEIFHDSSRWNAVVIGPGLGRHPETLELVDRVIREVLIPIVIDGDALAAVRLDTLRHRPWPWIATPHPGEMASLFNTTVKDVQEHRLEFAQRLVSAERGVAVLKGAKTIVAHTGGKPYVNPTGTPAMASGGMGDVLSGVIGALLAQGLSADKAAACGVFLHGLAAEAAAEENRAEAVSATQVIGRLQTALSRVRAWTGCTKGALSTSLWNEIATPV